MYSFENLNTALIGMCRELIDKGVYRRVRGQDCLEIPHPVMIEITNPTDRYITIPERKWNKYLPFAESLWIALGINDLAALPSTYCRGLEKYADNGTHWRAGYGPRIRAFSGLRGDQYISNPRHRNIFSGTVGIVDQLKYVLDAFKRDRNTRQAIIEIGDPAKDDFNEWGDLKLTKDYPCTRSVQFMIVDEKLNCTVYIRSNDVLFGLSAVNIFNFTLMQEYVANILRVPVGKYYHVINNLHLYTEYGEKVKQIASIHPELYISQHERWTYRSLIDGVEHFDHLCMELYSYEQALSRTETDDVLMFGNDLIDDWARVFMHHKRLPNIPRFNNPYLNDLFDV